MRLPRRLPCPALSVVGLALLALAGCATVDQSAPAASTATTVATTPAADVLDQAYEARRASHYEEARHLYEGWLAKHPKDPEPMFNLGATLYLEAQASNQPEAAKQLRLRAKELILQARALGSKGAALIRYDDDINADGSTNMRFSVKPAVEALMQRGEKAYTRGQYDEAIANYQAALELDPKLYTAALFIGDSYFVAKNYWKANVWFPRAVAIDPNVETAYRYWGDSLMRQGRTHDARDRFIEAMVAEPYNPYAQNGLKQYEAAARITVHHPPIKTFEAKFEPGEKGGNIYVKDNVDVLTLGYVASRAKWYDDEGKKLFPAGTPYRHSLAEEVYALRTVVKLARELKPKDAKAIAGWEETVDALEQLDKDGFLEAYVLFEGADEGIAKDYPAYRQEHRAQLIAYLHKVWFGEK